MKFLNPLNLLGSNIINELVGLDLVIATFTNL